MILITGLLYAWLLQTQVLPVFGLTCNYWNCYWMVVLPGLVLTDSINVDDIVNSIKKALK